MRFYHCNRFHFIGYNYDTVIALVTPTGLTPDRHQTDHNVAQLRIAKNSVGVISVWRCDRKGQCHWLEEFGQLGCRWAQYDEYCTKKSTRHCATD